MTMWETFWAVLSATILAQFCNWLFKKYIEPKLEKTHDKLQQIKDIIQK